MLFIIILLPGDIQFRHGPAHANFTFKMCALNTRALTCPLHSTTIVDLAEIHNIYVVALTETWLSADSTSAISYDFTFFNSTRPFSDSDALE
jgi:hypothetical protein